MNGYKLKIVPLERDEHEKEQDFLIKVLQEREKIKNKNGGGIITKMTYDKKKKEYIYAELTYLVRKGRKE